MPLITGRYFWLALLGIFLLLRNLQFLSLYEQLAIFAGVALLGLAFRFTLTHPRWRGSRSGGEGNFPGPDL